jgi:phosphoglycolate phosphatase
MRKKHLLIFDFDGVIADSIDLIREIYNEIHKKYNLPYAKSNKDVTELFYKNVFVSLSKKGLSPVEICGFFMDMHTKTLQRSHKMKPFPGIIDEINELKKQKHKLCIISSNHIKVIKPFLKKYKIDNVFKIIMGAEENASKVEKIKHVIKKIGARKGNTYYIGDTVGDIVEGEHAGVKTAATCWGYHTKAALEKQKPNFLIEEVDELHQIFNT